MGGLTKKGPAHRDPKPWGHKRSKPWREAVFERDGWTCRYCRVKVIGADKVPPSHPRLATIDHVMPLQAGGRNHPANYATACFKCNQAKGSRLDWAPGPLKEQTS